jgi:hypothetical protein
MALIVFVLFIVNAQVPLPVLIEAVQQDEFVLLAGGGLVLAPGVSRVEHIFASSNQFFALLKPGLE